jgi:23S rRNA pseudouridine1911/1915/1917 synthase
VPEARSLTVLSVEPNERITFKVNHEDDDLIVVEKPPRMPTQPGLGQQSKTLLNGLFARYGPQLQNLGSSRDFGLLHRLDRDASGLLIIALKPHAYDVLRQAFVERAVRKFYWAVTKRAPNKPDGVIRRPIVEVQGPPMLAKVSRAGKPALSAYRTIGVAEAGALLECRTITGRLHQVRVHLASISCHILGDKYYATDIVATAAPRLALHAHRLVFDHPTTGEKIDVRSRFPRDLSPLLRRMGLDKPEP